MEREKVGDLRRADELRLVCVKDVHRRAVIAPYDVLPVVHYFRSKTCPRFWGSGL